MLNHKVQENKIIDPYAPTQREMSRNARSMERRLKTPFILKYNFYLVSLVSIAFGVFTIVHKVIWTMLEKTYSKNWFHFITSRRPGNNYDTMNARSIYYIDGHTIDFLFKPAVVILIVGILMFAARRLYYNSYVKNEVEKLKKH